MFWSTSGYICQVLCDWKLKSRGRLLWIAVTAEGFWRSRPVRRSLLLQTPSSRCGIHSGQHPAQWSCGLHTRYVCKCCTVCCTMFSTCSMNCTGIPIHQIHYKRLPNYLLASQRGCNLQPPKSITILAASIPCCLAWDILLRAYC